MLFDLVYIDGQSCAVCKPVSVGSTHIFVPWLTPSSQQPHLSDLGHGCLKSKFEQMSIIFMT